MDSLKGFLYKPTIPRIPHSFRMYLWYKAVWRALHGTDSKQSNAGSPRQVWGMVTILKSVEIMRRKSRQQARVQHWLGIDWRRVKRPCHRPTDHVAGEMGSDEMMPLWLYEAGNLWHHRCCCSVRMQISSYATVKEISLITVNTQKWNKTSGPT